MSKTIENLKKLKSFHNGSYGADIDKAVKALEQQASYNSVNSLVESKLKNPKEKTFDILHFIADNAGLSTFEAIEKAYIMGVSEQEPTLDKIRAEIALNAYPIVYGVNNRELGMTLYGILEVIDKYKAESEVEE